MRVVRGVSPKQLNSGVCCFRVPPAFGKETPNGTLVLHRRLKGEWSSGILLGEARQLTKRALFNSGSGSRPEAQPDSLFCGQSNKQLFL